MVKYSEDEKWADIIPIPQDDGGPNPLAAIAYTESYSEAMSYLRAVMADNEMSERALDLTEDIIAMNPAHYTVWLYRAKILETLHKDLREEIAWLNHVALAHQKNYQIWHHRQFLLDRINDASGEIAFINRMLKGDAKNYHVWSYRQWLVRRFGLWSSVQESGRDDPAMLTSSDDEDDDIPLSENEVKARTSELEETEIYIAQDVRNNSAWNHRFFLVNGSDSGVGVEDDVVYAREVEFAEIAVRKTPQNQSPWNYLRGTVERAKGKKGIVELKGFCEEFVRLDPDDGINGLEDGEGKVTSSHALQLWAEISGLERKSQDAGRALELLATRYDPIRVNYWRFLKGRLGAEGQAVGA